MAPTATASTATAAASGSSLFRTTTFSVPFSLTLPTSWKVPVEEADMFTAYLPSAAGDSLIVGIDIQLVPVVHVDPCNIGAGTIDGGSTAADLAAWMVAFKPLVATAGAPTTMGGANALVIDEAFAATPCQNAELWPTPGGWLDATERKRYFVFEVGGERFVATIFSDEGNFAANVDAAAAVLATVVFGG